MLFFYRFSFTNFFFMLANGAGCGVECNDEDVSCRPDICVGTETRMDSVDLKVPALGGAA